MDIQKCQQEETKKMIKLWEIVIQPFYVLTIILLSLLSPLSVLLLSRLSYANFILSLALSENSSYLLLFVFLPALLYIFVSFINIAALINVLTGRITLLTDSKRSNSNISHPWLYAAWILLCTIQVTVGLGVEGSIAAGIGGYKFSGNEMSLLSRTICFLGLHETMLFWSRTVVKPVVDDTIFDGCRPERWIDRVAIAASFSGLWWWKLRKEYESLVMVTGAKMEFEFIIGWWFYYLIATIGILRIMKSSVWLGKNFLCRRVRRNPETQVLSEVEDKV